MIQAVFPVLLISVNLILYFLFGAALGCLKRNEMSLTRTMFAGLFFYYFLFTLCCLPVMLRWRPLHVLTVIWAVAAAAVSVVGALRAGRSLAGKVRRTAAFLSEHAAAFVFIGIFGIIFITVILLSYQFTLDASYYVGSVTTALQTDTVNMYDPFTGEWLDHYEMRYFFATFPMNDAVLCSISGVHPLLWCKITMAGTALVMTILVLYMTGRMIFGSDMKKTALFIIFALTADLFMITNYTSAAFLTTRTYEGKCLLANVVIPGIIYIYLCLLKDNKDRRTWLLLFLVSVGSPVLSSSANMLVPAMIGVTILPLALLKKDPAVIVKSLVCMVPGAALTLVYILYVKNIVVFYTYPR